MKTSSTRSLPKKLLEGMFIALFWLFVWWIVTKFVNGFYMPGPLETSKYILDILSEQETYVILFSSFMRVMISIAIALVLGIVLGVMAGLSPAIDRVLNPAMVCIKSTPVLSFILIISIYLSSESVPIFCSALLCIPIVYNNVLMGIRVVDKNLLEMSRLYKVKHSYVLKKIYLPSILPYINAAAIVCLGMAWKITVASEVLSVLKNSIGFMIYSAKVHLEIEAVFAWTIMIIICSFIIEELIKKLLEKNNYYKGMNIKNV